jgi:hypothetical protein
MNKTIPTEAPPVIINTESIVVIYEGRPYTVKSSDTYRFGKAREAYLNGDWEALYRSLDINLAIKDFTEGDISVVDGEVFYRGNEKLHGVVVDRLLELLDSGLSNSKPLIRFITNLLANPSKSSVDELYDFLSYKSLPIDNDGFVIGYKGVCGDYWSRSGNTETTVLIGEVNERGQILNTVGSTIEVARRSVDDDRRNDCSNGLHVGSYDYARDFANGGCGRLLMVRFDPRDAVSVPESDQCQKLRVCRYEVLSEVDGGEINEPYVDTNPYTVSDSGSEDEECGCGSYCDEDDLDYEENVDRDEEDGEVPIA